MGWVARGGKLDIGRVGGRYRLVERLGTGGMSVVWRGYDEILGRQVAVKVLSPQLADDVSFRDRLRQEALAAARLCHPHITGIFDFGESPLSTQLTVPYVVMELNDGESVAARLTRRGPMAWREAVVVTVEVASALATAHARGVVHRDVTPANVMLTSAGAKVVDFGISALVGERDAAPDGSLLGTPAYLAPERLGGGQVSPATDVYALGLLLYRCLTGRLPWPAATTTEALRAHLYAEPEPLPTIPAMPAEVASLALRCLTKKPADRPGAEEIARSLGALIGVQPVISPLANASPGAPAFNSVRRTDTSVRRTEPIPIGRPAAVAGTLVAAALDRLDLPGRLRTPGAVLRLRAGLRIGTALRLGNVRPLGGGLFTPGHPLPAASHRRPALVGRHRLQALAASVALLVAVGVSWSATREPAEVGPAQAAAVGAGAVVARTTGCKVRYQVRRDDGETFEALLTVLNTGERALGPWRLQFAYPGTQRLVDLPKTVDQNGRRVLLRGNGAKKLRPGTSVAVSLRGAYRNTNPLPLAFDLNGHACDVEILGPTTIDAETADDTDTGPVSAGRKQARGSPKRAERRPAQHREQPRLRTPRLRPTIKPVPSTPRPSPKSTPTAKPGGFSESV
jgi:serine/threonine-protein kinase